MESCCYSLVASIDLIDRLHDQFVLQLCIWISIQLLDRYLLAIMMSYCFLADLLFSVIKPDLLHSESVRLLCSKDLMEKEGLWSYLSQVLFFILLSSINCRNSLARFFLVGFIASICSANCSLVNLARLTEIAAFNMPEWYFGFSIKMLWLHSSCDSM